MAQHYLTRNWAGQLLTSAIIRPRDGVKFFLLGSILALVLGGPSNSMLPIVRMTIFALLLSIVRVHICTPTVIAQTPNVCIGRVEAISLTALLEVVRAFQAKGREVVLVDCSSEVANVLVVVHNWLEVDGSLVRRLGKGPRD